MRINSDFSQAVSVTPDQHQWLASPQAGVERVMLDRLGEEKARATSIVRYAPDSHFPGHGHPGGEEIFVLEGTFSDENGHYPAGWYLRNPPGSNHQPFSDEGCTIFVKLWQMPAHDKHQVRINSNDASTWQQQDDRETCLLFSSDYEHVCLLRLTAGDTIFTTLIDSAELLVLTGSVENNGQTHPSGSWIRLPSGEYPNLSAGPQGTTLYLKTGHLAGATEAAERAGLL